MQTCRKKTFLTTFLKPTGAKTLQKQYRRQAPEKKNLLSLPPPKKTETLTDLNLPPSTKKTKYSKISRKDGRSHCLDSIFAHWTTYWTTCEKEFHQPKVCLLLVVILLN